MNWEICVNNVNYVQILLLTEEFQHFYSGLEKTGNEFNDRSSATAVELELLFTKKPFVS